MKTVFVFILCVLIAATLQAQSNEPVRLAIVPETSEAGTAVDVITAEFSKNNKVYLLERTEIDRVYREQGLSAANKDYLKLGKVLGADGLLLLDVNKTPQATNLTTRLVAVKPGAVLLDEDFSWPLKDIPGWASLFTAHLNPFIPKLAVLLKDAIPISVVNLRSAVQSGEAQETERQLKLLTIQRLSREPQLFVLERQKMQLLTEEKDLKLDDSAFWNGSYLLEGVVDQNGYSKDTITINARLTPSKGGTPVPFEVSGSRTNFSEIINQLAVKVNEALKVNSTAQAWNTADEAAQYFAEAQWALKWGVYTEAQATVESAWALGYKTKEVAELRIRIYGDYGAPVSSDWLSQNPTSPEYALDTTKLVTAIRALELYQQGFHSFVLNEPRPDTNWFELGIHLLNSDLLRHFNSFPEACRGHEEELATLRLLSRNTVTMLQSSQLYSNMAPQMFAYHFGNYWHLVPSSGVLSLGSIPPITFIQLGACWYETPEEGLEVYRKLADTSYLHNYRSSFAYHNITGWTPADKDRSPVVWRAFIDELCGSTNLSKRVEGYFLNFADAKPPQQLECAQSLFKVVIETAGQLADAHLGDHFVKDIDYMIADPPNGFSVEIDRKVSQSFTAFQKDLADATVTTASISRIEAFKKYIVTQLSTNTSVAPSEFEQQTRQLNLNYIISCFSLQKSNVLTLKVVSLVPLLLDFQSELRKRAPQNDSNSPAIYASKNASDARIIDREITETLGLLEHIRTNTTAQAQPPVQPKRINDSKPTITMQVTRQIPILSRVSTNTLKVTHFWQWPPDSDAGTDVVPSAGTACFREGRVWIQVNYKYSDVYLSKAFVFGWDPITFSSDIIELPLVTNKFVFSSTESSEYFETADSFEVLREHIFITIGGKIKQYSFKSRTWEDLAVPSAGRLSLLDGRLFATTDDNIVEISPDGNSQTILASARRRPAMTTLDLLEHYSEPPIFHGPGGSIVTQIHDKLYAFNDKKRDWSEITSLPQEPASVPTRSKGEQDFFVYSSATWGSNQLFIPADQDSIAMSEPIPAKPSLQNSLLNQNKLEDLIGIVTGQRLSSFRIYLAKSKTWLLFSHQMILKDPLRLAAAGDRARREGYEQIAGSPLMYALREDMKVPMTVRLEIDLHNAVFSNDQLSYITYGSFGTGTLFVQPVPTPAGVVLVNANVGLWFIPWKELETLLQAAREERMAQEQARLSAINVIWTKLSEKYSLIQKDNFTPEQKEAMINDPAFLEFDFDNVDVNHNRTLDADELIYFDANKNGTLDPPEQAGIEATLSLLAQDLMDEYDLDGDGLLNQMESESLARELGRDSDRVRVLNFNQHDLNHDGALSVVELQSFLMQEMLNSISPQFRYPGSFLSRTNPYLKMAIENYWVKQRGRMGGSILSGELRTRLAATQPVNPPAKTLEEALFEAVDAGNLPAARTALEQGAKVDVRDDRGWTPLILAVKAGRLDMTKLLIEKGADVNAKSSSAIGSTVLCFAVDANSLEVVSELLKRGAEVNTPSRNGLTPLYSAVVNKRRPIAELLLSMGADVDASGNRNERGTLFTPLMGAACGGNSEMIELLLSKGAKLEQTNNSGATALMEAAKYPHPESIDSLIRHGADVQAKGLHGHTALIYAAYNGQVETVKRLLAAGADPSVTASEDDSPDSPRYDAQLLAEQQHHPEAATLISEAKAGKPRK